MLGVLYASGKAKSHIKKSIVVFIVFESSDIAICNANNRVPIFVVKIKIYQVTS